MPFLCVFHKRANEENRTSAIDLDRLSKLLCPYRGALTRHDLSHGVLFLSTIGGVTSRAAVSMPTATDAWAIPAGTRKNAQTAWLEIAADDHGALFRTDPLGTFPLWYFEDETRLVVTGEVKSLTALADVRVAFRADAFDSPRHPPDFSPYEAIRRVPPGAVLRVSRELLVTEESREALQYRPASMLASASECATLLESALLDSARAIGSSSEGRPELAEERGGGWGTFLSGGVDSSIATSLMKRLRPELSTFTLGTALGDEYADAEALAAYLGASHTRVFATEPDAIAYFERAVFCNETVDGLSAETLAQLGVLAAESATRSVRHIVTGYGADLLFGSMLRHELYMKVTGVDDLRSLIERTCWSGEFAPFFAWSLGVEIHHLFWDPSVMNCAFRIPLDTSFDGEREKIVLRDVACERGYMLREHAHRRKQALTDGTQFNQVLSSAFRLQSRHAYDEKNARCIAQLRRLYDLGHHGLDPDGGAT
jgi:asparagine synthetase B (glutamine-hydrolysing)